MGSGEVVPILGMIMLQLVFAGMTIISKLSIQSGMDPLVLVAYRQLFATAFIAPFAFCFERKTFRQITRPIMFQILLCSFTGVTGNQILYFVGLKYSTATIACALSNLLPAFTFILAVLFRQEHVRMKAKAGQAMVLGTVLGVGGAIFLSFYHGKTINLGQSLIHWEYAEKIEESSSTSITKSFLGPLFLIGSAFVWALWFIIQADLGKKYSAPYTTTTCMCFMATIQCVFIAVFFEPRPSAWSLANPMRLTSALYAGILCTGLACSLMSWTMERKGALFVSAFTPLNLVITAILSWALLQEKLYVGTMIGCALIVLGLYSVLWGKSKEKSEKDGVQGTEVLKENKNTDASNDLELQAHKASNCKHHTAI